MTEKKETAAQRLARAEADRAEAKAKLAEQEAEQRLLDLAELEKAELQFGANRVSHLNLPFTPGSPTMVIVRCPEDPEVKRYRFRIKPGKDGVVDSVGAAEELADNAVVFPVGEAYDRVRQLVPGIHAQAGVASIQLALGKAAEEGKG